jgi:hypothetical protein
LRILSPPALGTGKKIVNKKGKLPALLNVQQIYIKNFAGNEGYFFM